jgi:hypothetical protein
MILVAATTRIAVATVPIAIPTSHNHLWNTIGAGDRDGDRGDGEEQVVRRSVQSGGFSFSCLLLTFRSVCFHPLDLSNFCSVHRLAEGFLDLMLCAKDRDRQLISFCDRDVDDLLCSV